jgi:hypothetical protein
MSTLREAAQQALEALESLFTLQMNYILLEQREDAISALKAALEQQAQEPVTQMRGNALARWAHAQEEPPDTDWQRGYEAARRWVQQVGLPSLAQPLPDPVDEYRKGFIDGQIDMRDRPEEQEPVAYTGDVARRMREAGMTFHLGMPHAVVMQQMTRFHDLVCAEASIKSAAAFDIPPRREWRGLTDDEISALFPLPLRSDYKPYSFARAIEAKLKEKNA